MKYLKQIAYALLLIGGLNWGIYGISQYDLVEVIFGRLPMIAGIIYVLVGLSAVYVIINRYVLCDSHKESCCDEKKDCKDCDECSSFKVEETCQIKTE